MSKVEIRTVGEWDYGTCQEVEIYVDGAQVMTGHFGGEPEDNTRFRDYSWVDDAIESVAKALGAEVEFTNIVEEEEG